MSDAIDWQKLTPEQRDALVHEKVMGKVGETCTSTASRQEVVMRCDACSHEWSENEIDLQGYGPMTLSDAHSIPVPRYSTSMDAAWQVATCERFSQAHLEYRAGRHPEYECTLYADARFLSIAATAETPAEAICLAALFMVGVGIAE